jgi:hypothetical protein
MLRWLVRSKSERLVVTGKNSKSYGSRERTSRLLGVNAFSDGPYQAW